MNDLKRAVDSALSGLTTTLEMQENLIRTAMASQPRKRTKESTARNRVKLKLNFSLSFGLPHLVVAAIVIVLVMVLPLFAPGTRTIFNTWQSEDGEYYMVQGTGKEHNEQVAEADVRPTEYGAFECQTLEEAKQHFGTPMPTPSWLPERWLLENVTVIASEYSRMLNVVYTSNEGILIFSANENYEGAYYTYIEQDSEGEFITLDDGREIYITHNVNRLTVTWLENNMEVFFSGDFTREEAIRMAESVKVP